MISLQRTNAQNLSFKKFVDSLDIELAQRDGDEHSFYAPYNQIDSIKYVVVAYKDEKPVGCGAIKEYSPNTVEVKRMFTLLDQRGNGVASKILLELEDWAKELNYKKCILETGLLQPEAIRLYEKNGYSQIPNYGQYIGVENSRCFEKNLEL